MTLPRCLLCIGAGRVGAVTTVVLASHCENVKFILFDDDIDRVRIWQRGETVFYEPGLAAKLKSVLGKNLTVTHDLESAVKEADMIMVCLNTPTKTYGEGAGSAPDLSSWEKMARNISKYANSDKIVVESSTMPVKLGQTMKTILDCNPNGHHFDIVCLPSFIRGGSSLVDLETPQRILIGGGEGGGGMKGVEAVSALFEQWVPRDRIITTNLWSAELSKLALNAYKACRMSSTNAVSALCEASGADLAEVMRAVGADSRLGAACLRPSPGFGGACLRQNLLTLVYLCQHYGLNEVAEFWQQVIVINDYQRTRFTKSILQQMSSVSARRLAILGFAYKQQTNDIRESPAIDICQSLVMERAKLSIFDPQVSKSAIEGCLGADSVEVCGTAYDACRDADAVIILTEWDEFRDLDWQGIFDSMIHPSFVFDSRDILDVAALSKIGFAVSVIGKPPVGHK